MLVSCSDLSVSVGDLACAGSERSPLYESQSVTAFNHDVVKLLP